MTETLPLGATNKGRHKESRVKGQRSLIELIMLCSNSVMKLPDILFLLRCKLLAGNLEPVQLFNIIFIF